MTPLTTVILGSTAVLSALIAGLLYAYSCSVNPGLGKLGDREYLTAMQSINAAILNPLFMLSFVGTLILLPVSCYLNFSTQRFLLLLAATLVYGIGTFGVTAIGNVPLNEQLALIDLDTVSTAELTTIRQKFEGPWNSLHTIRTITSIVSLTLVIIACLRVDSETSLTIP